MYSLNEIEHCAITKTLNMIKGKWKPVLLYALWKEDSRFSELYQTIPSISKKVLAESLKSLEIDCLVETKRNSKYSLEQHYQLTEMGLSMITLFGKIKQWGILHLDNITYLEKPA